MSILYAISIVYIAGEYDGPGFCTPIGFHTGGAQQVVLIIKLFDGYTFVHL